MNNNLIILLRTQKQTMPIFEVEIYIPLTRLKPRCSVFYFIRSCGFQIGSHYKSERSYAIYTFSKTMCSLLLQSLYRKHNDTVGVLGFSLADSSE